MIWVRGDSTHILLPNMYIFMCFVIYIYIYIYLIYMYYIPYDKIKIQQNRYYKRRTKNIHLIFKAKLYLD